MEMKYNILFRGKRVIEPIKIERYAPDGWVYGGLLQCDDEEAYILPYDISGEMYINNPYRFRANDFDCSVMLAKIDPQSIGQFTGLIDKNGKKIFEGDIINYEYETFDKQKIFVKYIIKYNVDEARFRAELTKDGIIYDLLTFRETQKRAEVIGNIYDNKELLKR